MNTIDHYINKIAEASKKSTLSFFVGAGISKISGLPTWSELIDKMEKEMYGDKNQKLQKTYKDPLKIAEKYFHFLNDEELYKKNIKKFLEARYKKPNEIHDLMMLLKPSSFLTTNYDNLLEQSAVCNCQFYIPASNDKEIPNIDGQNFILKVHGDFTNNNFVLKESDYLNYSENFKLIETVMKSIFATNTVVFIGYSLNDYNIKLVLNWVNNVLKEKLDRVYLIYTDDKELDKYEIEYQKNRGLKVIDWHQIQNKISIDKNDNRHFQIQKCILEKIIEEKYAEPLLKNIEKELTNYTKEELFELLYQKLEPLNGINALRREDIKNALGNNISLSDSGFIEILTSKYDLFNYYIELYDKVEKHEVIPKIYLDKYNTITQVLTKAWIYGIDYISSENIECIRFNFNYNFIDEKILFFDFIFMKNFTERSVKNINDKYKQAYYFFLLHQYEKAFLIYKEVSTEAFASGNYLLAHLAQNNQIEIFKLVDKKNLNKLDCQYMNCINSTEISDKLSPELQFKYRAFTNIYTSENLYKNLYKAFELYSKLESNYENSVVEFGSSTIGVIISQLNESLHFTFGNYISTTRFKEFIGAMKVRQSALLFHVSSKRKTKLRINFFKVSPHDNEPIILDETDFYCLIEYFTSREIETLFIRLDLKQIKFKDISKIIKSIYNLFSYFDYLEKQGNQDNQIQYMQEKINVCVHLLQFVKIPIEVVEYITSIILRYGVWGLHNEKILSFLYIQMIEFRRSSSRLREIVLNGIIDCIDKEIKHFEKTQEEPRFFWKEHDCLARFLRLDKPNYTSKRLSRKLECLLEISPISHYGDLINIYHCVIPSTKEKFLKRLHESIKKDFHYKNFLAIITLDQQNIVKEEILTLVQYLEKEMSKRRIGRIYSSSTDSQFVDVGYWCFRKFLPKKYFKKFLGYDKQFDFFMDPTSFNYDQFELGWLLDYHPSVHKVLTKIAHAKKTISSKILLALKDKDVYLKDKNKLLKIYFEYYV